MSDLLGQHRRGQLFVMSAPAGTGKTTLIRKLHAEFPNVVASISFTTRRPREGEVEGVDYYFVSQSEFEEKIAADDYLEYVKLYETYYGTSRQWVEQQLSAGQHVFLVIDTQGARLLRGKMAATFIFIKPPSLDELAHRLRSRGTDSKEMIEKRLAWSAKEILAADEYEYQIINDDLETAYQVLRSILIAQCHRSH